MYDKTVLTSDDQIRCNECLRRLFRTKFICIQAIQHLIEQQREIDECMGDLKSTKYHAQAINRQVNILDQSFWQQGYRQLCCCCSPVSIEKSNDESNLLILPFPEQSETTFGLSVLEKDTDLARLHDYVSRINFDHHTSIFSSMENFQQILHDEYASLLDLARKITKCVQIIHDTIEFLGLDIKSTLDHMQSAQPRMRQLLKIKAPKAFAQVQQDLLKNQRITPI